MTTPSGLFTIGHSNHELEVFLDLLRQHQIEVLADVRSQPFSRYTPHFNREVLQHEIQRAGLKYLFLGEELGGRPDGTEFYDLEGHVLYSRVAESQRFLDGLERLKSGIQKYRVAIMCSEEDPAVCHRFLLVTRVLDEQGIPIQHIRGDGKLQSEQYISRTKASQRNQGLLFSEMEQDTWRSLQSVLPKVAPRDFSDE